MTLFNKYRTLKVPFMRFRSLSFILGTHGREESKPLPLLKHWEITSSSPTGVGGWVAGKQIPSMACPPSSTVSHFNQIFFIFNLNDWLIVDGAFYLNRCTLSLSIKLTKETSEVMFYFESVERSVMLGDKYSRGLDLQWVLLTTGLLRCCTLCAVNRESSITRYSQLHVVRANTRSVVVLYFGDR